MGDWGAAGKGALGGAATGAAAGAVAGPWGAAIGGAAGGLIGGIGGYFDGGSSGPTPEQKAQAAYAALAAQNYARNQQQVQAQLGQLQALQNGHNSVSALQLRQAMQQNQAQQMSMAAGASPNNAAMAMRMGMMQMGHNAQGLAGQQAVAGLQERNQATMAMNGLLASNGQLANSAALGGWGGNQTAANATYQQNLNSQNQWAGMLAGAGQAYAMGQGRGGGAPAGGGYTSGQIGEAVSDQRAKTDIKDGSAAATKLLDGLKAHLYSYKDPRNGAGTQLGVMAQDLERAGLGQAVSHAPDGTKVVNGAKLALGLAAALPGLHQRLAELEAARGK